MLGACVWLQGQRVSGWSGSEQGSGCGASDRFVQSVLQSVACSLCWTSGRRSEHAVEATRVICRVKYIPLKHRHSICLQSKLFLWIVLSKVLVSSVVLRNKTGFLYF